MYHVIPNISIFSGASDLGFFSTIVRPRSALFSDTTAIASYDLLVLALGLSAEIPFL